MWYLYIRIILICDIIDDFLGSLTEPLIVVPALNVNQWFTF